MLYRLKEPKNSNFFSLFIEEPSKFWSNSHVKEIDGEPNNDSDRPLVESGKGGSKGLCHFTQEISTCEIDILFSQ